MTGYEIPQFWARVIVGCSLAGMFIGVIFIVIALFRTKNKYNERLTATEEMVRVYGGQLQELDKAATIEIKQERLTKSQIPNKLLNIDNYLAKVVESQNLSAETIISMANKIFRWYDWFTVLFMGLTYSTSILRRIFKNTHINFVVRFAARFNLALREYGLGTLPTNENDKEYLQTYREIVQLESGLPSYITAKIHRNILLSLSLNSLRILRPDSPFWNDIEAKKIKPSLRKVLILMRNSLSMFMIQIDSAIVALRGEIAGDIERYIDGKQ